MNVSFNFLTRNILLLLFFIGTENNESCNNYIKVVQGEEVKEQEMDVISLSSSTLSDFEVITEEEINLLK